jgi:hypothetical protein
MRDGQRRDITPYAKRATVSHSRSVAYAFALRLLGAPRPRRPTSKSERVEGSGTIGSGPEASR